MKLHLPTALRRALLALIALLSPAVVTTTFATATLAAITAPAMADDLDLTLDSTYEFSGSVSFDSVTTGSPNDSIKATAMDSTFTANTVSVGTGHMLTVEGYNRLRVTDFTVKELNVAEGGFINFTDGTYVRAASGVTLYDLFKGVSSGSVKGTDFYIYGAGHSAAETEKLVKSSDLFGKLHSAEQGFINITEGNLIIDADNTSASGGECYLYIGDEEGSTDAFATITGDVTRFDALSVVSDDKLTIEKASEKLTLKDLWVEGLLESHRDLVLEGHCTIVGKLTLGGTIENNGTVRLGDWRSFITVDSSSFAEEHIPHTYTDGDNGYLSGVKYTVITGAGTLTGRAFWFVDDMAATYEDGKVIVSQSPDTAVYYVASGTIDYGTDVTDLATDTTKFCMKGGSLVLSKNLKDTQGIKVDVASSVSINNDVTLKANQLDASAADVTLRGEGAYDLQGQELSGEVTLDNGVTLDANEWKGTVYTGSTAQGAALDITALGNSQSTVYLGAQPMRRSMPGETVLESLTAAGVGTTEAPGSLTLQKGTSTADALVVNGILTLGSADAVASLVAVSVDAQALNVQLTDEVLSNKDAGETLTLVTLEEGFEGTLTFNGSTETERVRSEDNRKEYTLAWNEAGTALTLTILGTETYVAEQVKPTTHNGKAGVALMTDVFLNSRPQKDVPDGALASILNAVDAGTATDRDMAAVAGASTAALGMALSGDVERQLRAIRNRSLAGNDASTTTLVDEKSGMMSAEAPARFFAWVNAEGNRAEQNDDSTAAGYTLTSWGGTVGAGMQVNNQLTLGLALTAMYGDLQSDGPDYLKGDMDTTYVSAFARYNRGKWSHAFIGTAGTMEADYKRSAMSYSNTGDTDGTVFGLMYEVSREFELGNLSTLSPVLNIAYRHTAVDSYSESGADAALNVGKQSMDTVTVGAGARYAAVVGQQTLNRACGFEVRALVKYDLGDRQSTTSTGFTGYATRAGIESAELGAFGVELGAGISVPVGTGSIFADGAVELRSVYTNFNATVGYRVQF